MSISAIRAAIYSAVNGVSNVGKVYDYERWAADWPAFLTLFKTTISATDQIRGFEVMYRGEQAQRDPQFARQTIREHTFWIQGYMGIDDSAATEKTFSNLVEDVADALDAASTLHSGVYKHTAPVSIPLFEPRTFGGTLCHYCQITMIVSEQVS